MFLNACSGGGKWTSPKIPLIGDSSGTILFDSNRPNKTNRKIKLIKTQGKIYIVNESYISALGEKCVKTNNKNNINEKKIFCKNGRDWMEVGSI